MSEAQLSSYEEVPYESKPLYPTHPDCTGTLASLMGLSPAPATRCRVLELGCATGGNLFPMAEAFPESEFVGIDLAPRQIAMGQAILDSLGLRNLTLRSASIMDLDETLGKFDYIICHGVYSWVPPEVQDKILSLCKSLLSRNGIAYVSYNTFPGWHQRRMIREILHFHADRFTDPTTKVKQSRAFLDFLVKAVPARLDTYRRIIEGEMQVLNKTADFYLFHEHLEDINTPIYFREFMQRAHAKGLQYLGESFYPNRTENLPEDVQATLQGLSENLLEYEQYSDILLDRTFRRTLLVHDDVEITRTPSLAVLQKIHLASLVRPVSEKPAQVDESEEKFEGEDGAGITTNHPVFKIALRLLYDAWPKSVPYNDLIDRITNTLEGSPYQIQRLEVEATLANRLLGCYMSNLISIHLWPPQFVLEVSDRPQASPLARLQAQQGVPLITNLRHRVVKLETLERMILPKLDGQNDRSALMAHLFDLVQRDILDIQKDGETVKDLTILEPIVRDALESSLHNLARSVLLIS